MIYKASLRDYKLDILKGYKIITKMSELYQALKDKDCKEIIITKEFSEEFFTPSALGEFITDISNYRSDIKIQVDILYQDINDTVKAISNIKTYEELNLYISRHRKDILSIVHSLAENYLKAKSETLIANNKISTMHLNQAKLNNKIEEEKQSRLSLEESYTEAYNSYNALIYKINYNYNKSINKDEMFYVPYNMKTYTGILYIKEITRVRYIDTLVYYLKEILNILYTTPSRLLVIEPFYADDRYKLYPSLKNYRSLTYNDVFKEDIFMAGFSANLMKDILRNSINMQYLIILDRSQCNHLVLSNIENKVDVIFTVSELKDAEIYNITPDKTNCISYSSKTLYIPYIEDFESKNQDERIMKYSSLEVTKNLINILETRK